NITFSSNMNSIYGRVLGNLLSLKETLRVKHKNRGPGKRSEMESNYELSKRLSEFLGGPGKKRMSSRFGVQKKYSEFLGGPGKPVLNIEVVTAAKHERRRHLRCDRAVKWLRVDAGVEAVRAANVGDVVPVLVVDTEDAVTRRAAEDAEGEGDRALEVMKNEMSLLSKDSVMEAIVEIDSEEETTSPLRSGADAGVEAVRAEDEDVVPVLVVDTEDAVTRRAAEDAEGEGDRALEVKKNEMSFLLKDSQFLFKDFAFYIKISFFL
ncbi:unnamed protein product, partial [Medioppia subpectinata]